jgi:selenium metabolism protein YedF
MNHKIVDCRGLACPHPVINTKKALEEAGIETIITIVDNDVARQNVMLFAKNAGHQVKEEQKDGFYHLTITRNDASPTAQTSACADESSAVTAATAGRPVYFITTNELGQGSPDLGEVLIKSMFTTLAAMTSPPAALLFLNTGVYLTCEGSPVQKQLEKLYNAGTAILTCGTCLEYYHLKNKLLLGNISNMLEINDWLSGPYKAITIA